MRIVQIVGTLDLGGLERLAVDLAIAHKQAGHECYFYCIFAPGKLAPVAESAGIPVVAFGKRPGFSPQAVYAIARQLKRHAAMVVHTHNGGIHHYGAVAASMARTPVVVNTRHSPATGAGAKEAYFYWSMPLTDHVVAVSEDARQFLLNRVSIDPEKLSVIVNGIPVTRFLSHTAAPGSRRPKIRFGTVGRLVWEKAHSVLIDAFAELSKSLPDAELSIAGDGPLWNDLNSQVERLGLRERVNLCGAIDRVEDFYRSLDLFVFSSISEGLPLVILEAMSAGLPIVSTRIGGVPEVAPEGKVAWYCEPGNSHALAQAMLQAALGTDLQEKGVAAARIALGKFSIEKMQKSYEALFLDILRRRNG